MLQARSLSLRSVIKSYIPGQRAVNDVSLEVQAGEFVTFLGPSGSGKTTTLMMIAGFEAPDGGDILIGGRKIDQVKPYDRNIGMVFQNYALFPHMSAFDNVSFPLRMRGLPRDDIERRAKAMLDMVGLGRFGNRRPSELSGGQQQRVALARALVFEPDLVLMDEPLGALDKTLREQMQIEIKRIHRDLGVTMIYVTHDQTEAMTMSDRIAVFSQGRIEQIGTPREVYFTPHTHFVASFVGDSNLLSGEMLADGRVRLEGLGEFAAKASRYKSGDRLTVLIRPETIGIAAPAGDNSDMLVEDVVNFGDNCLVVGTVNGTSLRVRAPSISLPELAHGDRCGLVWRSEHFHFVDKS